MCARSYSPTAISLLNVHYDTDNIRAIGQVPQRIWRITQIVDEHIEKARQKAGEGSRREARRTKATSCGANPYRGPETGQRPKEAAKEGQGRIETGSGSPTHTGKAGVEREDEVVNRRVSVLAYFCHLRLYRPSRQPRSLLPMYPFFVGVDTNEWRHPGVIVRYHDPGAFGEDHAPLATCTCFCYIYSCKFNISCCQ